MSALRRVKAAIVAVIDDSELLVVDELHEFKVADLREVVRLADVVESFLSLNLDCFITGETAPRKCGPRAHCICATCMTVAEARRPLPKVAPKRARKR